jgi:hypothetical protein
MTLLPDWKDVLRRAWSVRFIVLAGLLSGAELVLPMFAHAIPNGIFAALSFLAVSAAFVARVLAQRP